MAKSDSEKSDDFKKYKCLNSNIYYDAKEAGEWIKVYYH